MNKSLTFKIFLLLSFITPLFSADLTVKKIIEKANLAAYYKADDGKALVLMTITDKQGRTRTREFSILRKDKEDGGDQFFYIYFKKPSDVRKMVFMVWKHVEKDDDRWLYLPALDLVKRIAASDKRTSFVGSNFVYEDVSGRAVDADKHELTKTTDQHYIIRNTPKDLASVEFSEYKVWIDKTTFLPMKAEYLDKSGAKYRTVEATKTQTIQGYPTIIESKVHNLTTGSSTTMNFSKIKYDIGLKESLFSERYLRRAPREARR